MFIIPVKPSGILYHLPIVNEYKINDIYQTIKFLENIRTVITIKVIGFVYNSVKDNIYVIESLYIAEQINVPVIHIKLNEDDMAQLLPNYILEYRSSYEDMDIEIKKGKLNKINDARINAVNKNSFDEEHYELFRYELSNYLTMSLSIKNKIVKIIEENSLDGKNKIKKLLLQITSENLFNEYSKLITNDNDNMEGGSVKFVHIDNMSVDYNSYIPRNNRELCIHNKNKKECNNSMHCTWNKQCMFKISDEQLIEFISKISNELVNNVMKSKEILNEENYFVLDVIDIGKYTYRKNQKIIKSDNMNIKKLLGELFGESNIPIIGKRRIFKTGKNIQEENINNLLVKIGKYKYQTIINSNVLFRAYTNAIPSFATFYTAISHDLGHFLTFYRNMT